MQTQDDIAFESQVRSLARAMYPNSGGGDADIEMGRERDCIIFSGDDIIVIEATTSRRADKVRADCKKTQQLIHDLRKRYTSFFVRGFVVTRDDPTAEQMEAAKSFRKDNIILEGFQKFRARAYDAEQYVRLRKNYMFGSAKELSSPDNTPPSRIIDIDLLDKNSGRLVPVQDIIANLKRGLIEYAILIGDFGAGKSTTLYQIWNEAARQVLQRKDFRLPIFLNLRDHAGQEDPAEALLRHATKIGYSYPQQLVAAFRAGHSILFLDGVDEIAPFARLPADSRRLRETRRKAVTLVRRFIAEAPGSISIMLSSRAQYFDSKTEMSSALGLNANWKILSLNEFSFEQVKQFLNTEGLEGNPLPEWIPSRPLLLAYLASSGLLSEVLKEGSELDPASAWSTFFDMICRREGSRLDIDPTTVRLVIERVATLAGKVTGGIGPIEPEEILRTLSDVTGSQPDEGAEQLVLRLPGLGPLPDGTSKRMFLDETLADVARAGDVARYISSPFDANLTLLEGAVCPLRPVGAGVAWRSLKPSPSPKLFAQALENLSKLNEPWATQISLMEVIMVSDPHAQLSSHSERCIISNGYIERLDFSQIQNNISFFEFHDCLVQELKFSMNYASIMPRFINCIISTVFGAVSSSDLPEGGFSNCQIELFAENFLTTAQMLRSNLEPMVAVVCTCLEKLFLQPGRGRDQSAFPRGLDSRHRPLVQEALELIQKADFASPYRTGGKTIWVPNRSKMAAAREILAAPHTSRHELVRRARSVSS